MARFGSSGIRGIWGEEIGPGDALVLGFALAHIHGAVASCWDTRTSSPVLHSALEAGVLSAGGDSLRLGMGPTPLASFAAKDLGVAAVSVTASHNPPEYAGLKPFAPGGQPFFGEALGRLKGEMEKGVRPVSWDSLGEAYEVNELEAYLDAVTKGIEELGGLRVVIDCGNGTTSLTAPAAFKSLGAEVETLNCEPSPMFNRDPEPGPDSLSSLSSLVREMEADMGAAFDPDGDRFVAVDPRGRVIMGAEMAYILGEYLGVESMVVSVDSPSYLDSCFKVRRTRVGDVFVTQEMVRSGIKFGFEPSGTQILMDHLPTPDGLRAALLLAEASREEALDSRLDSVPKWGYVRFSLPLRSRERLEGLLESLEGVVDRVDGARLRDGGVFVLIRPSGTEPKVRVAVDGPDEEEVRRKAEKWRERLERELG